MMAIEGHSAPIVAAAAAVVGPLDAASVGRQAALIVAARITEELPHVLDTMDRIELRLDRERANNRAEDLKSIEIDIAAGSITVGALNPADVTELIRLAGDLDESIVRSKLLNLTLQAVGQVLDSVVRVKDILKS